MTCRVIRPNDKSAYHGKQGADFKYFEGISKETVGSNAICMHLLQIPPHTYGRAHKHENHETAIFVAWGEAYTWYGEQLENHVIVKQGDFFYIPANVPHLPANLSDEPCIAIIARTDPNEQESTVLLPELEEVAITL